MNRKNKKILSMITALSMTAVCMGSMNISADDAASSDEYTQFPYTAECEDLIDGDAWTDIYGQKIEGDYSGDGFVYLTSDTIELELNVPEDDMYEISVKCAQILSEDGRAQTICINGSDFMYQFPYSDSWTDFSFGVHRLKAGKNVIQIKPQYGYACYDTITVTKAELPDLSTVKPVLSDSKATKETQCLMNYLTSVYGKNIISGQQEIYGSGHDGDYEYEFDWIENLTGKLPAIRGFDYMNYNPLYGWDDNTTERIIEWTNERNGIATVCWHINIPVDFNSYELGDAVDWSECTYKPNASFNAANASIEGTKEYQYFMLAVDDLAEQIARLQDANVPIIFRPLHEAEGNGGLDGSGAWFWWSSAGAEAYNNLWKLLYTTLTEKYDLHNIIWEQNLYTWSSESAQWYSGDEYVDIVGYDKYNTVYNRNDGLSNCPNEDAISTIFYNLVDVTNNTKMVAMAENDTVPSIENMTVEKAGWLYFCPWYEENLMDTSKNNPDTLISIYQSDYCITLDELPDWKTFELSESTDPETTTTSSAQTETTTATDTEDTSATDTEPAETTVSNEETSVSSDNSDTTADTSGNSNKEETTPTLLGDVNCDDTVDVRDVTSLKQSVVKLIALNPQQTANADVISDNIVDVKDLGQLIKYIIKVIDKF